MTSKIVEKKTAEPAPKYPALFEYTGSLTGKFVILATGEQTGTVVQTEEDSGYDLGTHGVGWSPFTNRVTWKPFEGKIELTPDDDES